METLMRWSMMVVFIGICGCGDDENNAASDTPLSLDCQSEAVPCGDGEICEEQSDGSFACVTSPFIDATIRVINPAMGGGFSGVEVTGETGAATTDGQGLATVQIRPGAYTVEMNVAGSRTHRVFGHATSSFEQVTYMSPDMITQFVYSSLRLTDNSEAGILVVGLDLPNLAPAIGASANIDSESDDSFLFVGNRPTAGNELVAGSQGFVTFPNVAPGPVQIQTAFATGECRVFPSEEGEAEVVIRAGEVSIVAYTCRNAE